jgi:hypothetical protein
METKVVNKYIHAESKYKTECRALIIKAIMDKFPIAKTKVLNTLTLGGEDLKLENDLDKFYNLKGVSYEFNPSSAEKARQNAPQGVTIVNDNIFNHEIYGGRKNHPQLIWFDFMTSLRYENVSLLLKWLTYNFISNDTIFVVTYSLHSRYIKGEGYRQLFDSEDEHDAFIEDMANYIAINLENPCIEVDSNVSITKYCNVDIDKRSLPMVQFIFKTTRKKL